PSDPNKTVPGLCGCGTPDVDGDADGVVDCHDNCVGLANPSQADGDGDLRGDACDDCPADPANDADHDGRCGNADNCPSLANPAQENADGDALGDACDPCPEIGRAHV